MTKDPKDKNTKHVGSAVFDFVKQCFESKAKKDKRSDAETETEVEKLRKEYLEARKAVQEIENKRRQQMALTRQYERDYYRHLAARQLGKTDKPFIFDPEDDSDPEITP